MFTWTHIDERRFDWRAFRLQNKILSLLFLPFNHQNVNSKCNNDAQMWKSFSVNLHFFEKRPKGLFGEQQRRSRGVNLTNTGWNSLLCQSVAPKLPSMTVHTNKPSCFKRKCDTHICSDFWDMHFCSNIYPVSTLKVKICENKTKTI